MWLFALNMTWGLSGVHPDKSAANICKLRQWSSQQPSSLAYIETCSSFCLVRARLEVSNTSPFEWSLYLALLPLTLSLWILGQGVRANGFTHIPKAEAKAHPSCVHPSCVYIQQFATIQVTKFASPSVRWTQLLSLIWPDLLDIRRVAIT